SLTAEVFMRTLERSGLQTVSAGIALQAYIPDSFATQRRINEWARRRVETGGAPVIIRIVKGANMEMERVEASIKGWPQAPFKTKRETDANFKRMLHEGMKPENLAAVRLGVASHNLFDMAYSLALAQELGALDRVQFEMLEGMANPQRRALHELLVNLLLYSPVCRKEDFLYAIGYLVRRLDENTGPENFLSHAFKLAVDSPDWKRLEQGFLDAFDLVPTLGDAPRRTQNRNLPPEQPNPIARGRQNFVNEPDTDWSLPHNARWAKAIVAKWEARHGVNALEIPLVVAGEEIFRGNRRDKAPSPASGPRLDGGESLLASVAADRDCLDPSRPGFVVGRYLQATQTDIERAVQCADADPDGWRALSFTGRQAVLRRVAHEIRVARADLIGAAMANGGKIIFESDPEVSEAVDFVEFYADAARHFSELPGLEARGKGAVVVVSPWNFPIAIPCGGVAAALAAGNTVILKPASDTVLAAWELCQCFWRGGVSKRVLQFLPCSGGVEGRKLVAHAQVDAAILTGGTATALAMLRDKPDLPLAAETGGKNATIVTALADRDLAIKNVVHSAFSHAGQKCSATSLLLLEAEVYDDPEFKRSLCEAVESLHVGPAWDLKTKVNPIIRPPSGDLQMALTTLEPGESWAVPPREVGDNRNLWSPGVKWGVQPGSRTHLTEFFGPVLGVMRFEKLSEAIALVNQTGYGLTSALESLDDREQGEWQAGIGAGNLYINRTTVGAVVLRQPFGGMGKSAFGAGLKAGGPNYVAQFMHFDEVARPPQAEEINDPLLAGLRRQLHKWEREPRHYSPEELARVVAAIGSYELRWREEFGCEHDHFRLIGQDNLRRYLPVQRVRVRVHPDDSPFEIFARICAAWRTGCAITVSTPPDFWNPALTLLDELTASWAPPVEFVDESDQQLAEVILARQMDRVRCAARVRVPLAVREAAAEANVFIADSPVLMEGRVELLWYLQEQSISFDYHRYGNLGARAGEVRVETL
ncbi:MAG TPA: proline dehydrogenase family protein, partial [Verrucomicrobiae bacterium]